MNNRFSYMHWLLVAVIAAIVTACASIGRPEGGPRDFDPPVYVSSTPKPGQLNVDANRITVTFDENIQLDDAFNKIVVSPVQTQAPAISSNARRVTVELRDTMIPNTTYSIDFADAIKDLNEGNILDGFALEFSTGDTIDSLRISGMVLEARTLEPAQGMLVGVYSNLDDSAITTLPLERIARTNQLGQFTVRTLKPGTYRIFALNDMNRDYKWDRSEDIAFYDFTVSPTVENIEVTDSFITADGRDSLVTRPGIQYLPNDILLSWFNEGYKAQYLKDYKRPDRRRLTFEFATRSDTVPEISVVGGPQDGRRIDDWAVTQVNPTRDSLVYWMRDTLVSRIDSLYLSVKYLKTDTTDNLAWQTDTLKFFFKDPKPDKKKKKDKDEKPDTVITDAFGVPQPKDFLSLNIATSTQDVNLPLVIRTEQPIDSIKAEGIRLSLVVNDSTRQPVEIPPLIADSLNPLMIRKLALDWTPGASYHLEIDSTAFTSVFGLWNKPYSHDFKVKQVEEYANLFFNITGLEPDSAGVTPHAVVELLTTDDKVVRIAPVVDGRAEFRWLAPNTYYARLYIDSNGNGRWDPGDLRAKIQPEETYYYNKKLQLKKNWDIEQAWNIYELPVDLQKPMAIKKNKPKPKKGEKGLNEDEEEEEYDEFGNPIGGYGNDNPYDPNNLNNRRPGANDRNRQGGFGNNRRGF